MGYSERSLRRLVDRIEDGTTNPEEEPVLILAGATHTGTVSDEVEDAHFMNNEEDIEAVGRDITSREEYIREHLDDTEDVNHGTSPDLP